MANLLYSQTSAASADKVIRTELDSAGTLDSGVVKQDNIPGSGTETYAPFFDANGNANIQWAVSSPDQTALGTTAHIHFEVAKALLSEIGSLAGVADRLMTLAVGGKKVSLGLNSLDVKLGNTSSNIISFLHKTNRAQDFVVFDVYLDGITQTTHIDNIFITSVASLTAAADFVNITIAASQSGTEVYNAEGELTAGIKNVYVYSALQQGTGGTVNLVQYGDSQVQQGQWHSTKFPTQATNQANEGDNNYLDQGASASIWRVLANNGIDVTLTDSQAIAGASVQGTRAVTDPDTTNDLVTQIALGPADLTGTVVELGMGTNDFSGGALDKVAFQEALQTHINSILALNPLRVLISTVATRAHATPGEVWFQSSVDDANDAIRAVAHNDSRIFVFDVFTALGGHSAPASFFNPVADSVPHYSLDGQRVSGEAFASEFLFPTGSIALTGPLTFDLTFPLTSNLTG